MVHLQKKIIRFYINSCWTWLLGTSCIIKEKSNIIFMYIHTLWSTNSPWHYMLFQIIFDHYIFLEDTSSVLNFTVLEEFGDTFPHCGLLRNILLSKRIYKSIFLWALVYSIHQNPTSFDTSPELTFSGLQNWSNISIMNSSCWTRCALDAKFSHCLC